VPLVFLERKDFDTFHVFSRTCGATPLQVMELTKLSKLDAHPDLPNMLLAARTYEDLLETERRGLLSTLQNLMDRMEAGFQAAPPRGLSPKVPPAAFEPERRLEAGMGAMHEPLAPVEGFPHWPVSHLRA
jgi:hypothetical protein